MQLGSKGFGDPLTFDNAYYKSLLQKPWEDPRNDMASMIGLPSDHVLPDDANCRPTIEAYARSQQQFYEDFRDVYLKLMSLGAQWS
jgi:L-ascorbate peroxidase